MATKNWTNIAGCIAALFFTLTCSAAVAADQSANAGSSELVYVGTGGNGFYAFRFDPATGHSEPLGQMALEIVRPTTLTTDPAMRFLYSTSEVGNDGKSEGAVYSYKLDRRTGSVQFLNKAPAGGGGTTFIAVDRSGKILAGDNYGNGQVVVFKLNANGSLGERTELIQHTGTNPAIMAHPHEAIFAADNRHVLVPDVGLNRVYTYLLDANRGTLTPGKPPFVVMPGDPGTRHLVMDPHERFVYVLDERAASVTQFDYKKSTGELKQLQTVPLLPDDFSGTKSATDIWIAPSGRFLYATCRSNDTVLVFSIDPDNGTLTLVQRAGSGGKYPHAFAADTTGRYLFVVDQQSESVAIFRIDPSTGMISATGETLNVPVANSLLIIPAANQ